MSIVHRSIYTPLGSVRVNNYQRDPDAPKRDTARFGCRVSRGRHKERQLTLTAYGWEAELSTRAKRCRDLAGFHLNIDWVIDEFDASFNDLACASLRYHLDFSVASNEHLRTAYEDLIARLSETHPVVADTLEKETILDRHHDFRMANMVKTEHGHYRPSTARSPVRDQVEVIYEDFYRRDREYQTRIQQARHDFVDVIPELWS